VQKWKLIRVEKSKMDIAAEHKDSKIYNFLKIEKAKSGDFIAGNATSATLSCKLIVVKNAKPNYELEIKNYRQENNNGLYGLVNDLQVLKSHMIITISENGLLDEIINIEEIKQKWLLIKKKLMAKHGSEVYGNGLSDEINGLLKDGKSLAASLRYATPFITLFSGFSNETETQKSYREMPNFIPSEKIPILLKANKVENDNTEKPTEVIAEGKIDDDNHKQPNTTEFIKRYRDNLRAISQPRLQYEEHYFFKDSSLPIQASYMNTMAIPGFLYQSEKTYLKEML